MKKTRSMLRYSHPEIISQMEKKERKKAIMKTWQCIES